VLATDAGDMKPLLTLAVKDPGSQRHQ